MLHSSILIAQLLAHVIHTACHYMEHALQISVTQAATASAFLTEPAWGVASALSLHTKAGVLLSLPGGSPAQAVYTAAAQTTALAKQQVDHCLSTNRFSD